MKTPQPANTVDQLAHEIPNQNQRLATTALSSTSTLVNEDSLVRDSTPSLVNSRTVSTGDFGDAIFGTTVLPMTLAPVSPVVSDLQFAGALATSSTIPLVVPALTLPPHLEITWDWRSYCETLGAGILAEYLACELDPFWMLTTRPPKNWSKEWIGQAIKAAAIEYHRETYGTGAFTNDDFVYYAAILWSQRSKRWHAHLLCQTLPLYPDLLVHCFKNAVNEYPGTVNLQDHADLRTAAARNEGWLGEIQALVDYRTYVAGRRNITGHYGWDPAGLLDPHVELYSPVLKHFPERERLVIEAEPVAIGGTTTPGNQQSTPDCTGSPSESKIRRVVGRKLLRGMRLESCTVEDRYGMIALYHLFRDDQGLTYRWRGSNPEPVNVRGNRRPGRYRLISGVAHNFDATTDGHWPDGAIKISRPYFRLDVQPEATTREYARKYGISMEDLRPEGQ